MANGFGSMTLTTKGKNLLAKAQTGTTLSFTRVAIGSGNIGDTDVAALSSLIAEEMSLNITDYINSGSGTATICTTLSNSALTTGFYWREIGIFATDPSLGEILYGYASAGDGEIFIPAASTSSFESACNITISISNASSVTAVIDSSLVYATKTDIDNIKDGTTVVSQATNATTAAGYTADGAIATEFAALNSSISANSSNINDCVTFDTAGGTETAITLTTQTLANGYSKTFIASAGNSGAATTINGIPLYKPNSTMAPTIVAGKAYTVWYNAAGNCFFLKASATGTATAAQVLAGATFSNDNETDLTGTIPSKAAATYTPGTSDQTIAAGQYLSGAQVIKATTGTATADRVGKGYTFNSAAGIGLTGTADVLIPTAGDYLIVNDTTLYGVLPVSGAPQQPQQNGKKIYVFYTGIYRIKFSIYTLGVVTAPMYAQIYKNDVAAGTLRSTNSATIVEFSEDFTANPNDHFCIMLWFSESTQGYIKDIGIYYNFKVAVMA